MNDICKGFPNKVTFTGARDEDGGPPFNPLDTGNQGPLRFDQQMEGHGRLWEGLSGTDLGGRHLRASLAKESPVCRVAPFGQEKGKRTCLLKTCVARVGRDVPQE